MSSLKTLLAAGALMMIAISPAAAIDDPVVQAARSAGQIGEQADGYLGVVSGASVSADARARMEQINIERRAYFTQLATQNNASATEMAFAIACRVLRSRVPVGEHYRDGGGTWRQHTASAPVQVPAQCPNQ